jgi:hypothetical protein
MSPQSPPKKVPTRAFWGILPPDWPVAQISSNNPIRYLAVRYGGGLHQSPRIHLAQNEPGIHLQRSLRSLFGHPSNTPFVSIGFIAKEARKNHFHWPMEIGLLLLIVMMMLVIIERALILGFIGSL